MIYKLASESKRIKIEKEIARQRADIDTLSGLVPFGRNIAGYIEGENDGHPVVGAVFGPVAVTGARAKDTGISTLDTTVKRNARNGAILGGGLGALTGLAVGARYGLPEALVGGLIGGIGGSGVGAASLGARGAIGYGIGYALGKRKPHKKTKKIKKTL